SRDGDASAGGAGALRAGGVRGHTGVRRVRRIAAQRVHGQAARRERMKSTLLANLRSFVLPLAAAGIVPALLVWRGGWAQAVAGVSPLRAVAGGLLATAGLAMLAWTVTLFVRVGRGTLAPWDPTRKLVVRGPYAHVRNPMISGVLTIIVGEAI